jgi:hypothetical protein
MQVGAGCDPPAGQRGGAEGTRTCSRDRARCSRPVRPVPVGPPDPPQPDREGGHVRGRDAQRLGERRPDRLPPSGGRRRSGAHHGGVLRGRRGRPGPPPHAGDATGDHPRPAAAHRRRARRGRPGVSPDRPRRPGGQHPVQPASHPGAVHPHERTRHGSGEGGHARPARRRGGRLPSGHRGGGGRRVRCGGDPPGSQLPVELVPQPQPEPPYRRVRRLHREPGAPGPAGDRGRARRGRRPHRRARQAEHGRRGEGRPQGGRASHVRCCRPTGSRRPELTGGSSLANGMYFFRGDVR